MRSEITADVLRLIDSGITATALGVALESGVLLGRADSRRAAGTQRKG